MSLTLSPAEIVEQSTSPLVQADPRWARVQLGEVATILNGAAFKSGLFSDADGVPLIRIRDIRSQNTTVRYAGSFDARYLISPGELLVGMDGDFNVARWNGPKALLNQRVCCLRPDEGALDIDFLSWILPGYLQAIHDVTSSTTVKHLSSRDIAAIPIPLPELGEQRRIAARLNEISARKASVADRLSAAHAIVDRLRAAVLATACCGRLTADWREDESPEGLPPSWSRVALGDLVASIRGGSTEVPSDDPTPFPILRSSSVRPFTVDYADVRYLSAEQSGRADNFITNGDLLVTRLSGSLEFVGNAARVQAVDELSVQYPDRLFRLQLADARHAEYLEIFMASQETRRQVAAATRSAAGHQRISISDLRAFEVNLPSLGEQQEIVRRARAALESAQRVENAISVAASALETAMRAALRKAFRGELIPSGAELVTA